MNTHIGEADPSLAATIEAELLASLRAALPQGENSSFVLAARDPEESLTGGLTASTSYGWLLIKTLWVDEGQRHNGIGRQLMHCAEQKGRSLGCHAAWLDTSSPDALGFYEALGYEVFGQLENGAGEFPESHRRWFLRKSLCKDD